MAPLNNQQKQLLFDYCIGLTTEKEAAEAETLISSNEEATEIHSMLKFSLLPLDSLSAESCPDDLVEGTVWRLNNLARSSQLQLQQLLATEQARGVTAKSMFWRDLGKRLAAAAVFVIVGSTLITSWRVVANYARKQQCQMQLARIFQGINNYTSDHDGRMPAVATATGEPWWKVGYQGKENHSNTRSAWLLVKEGYVKPVDFVCPGHSRGIIIQIDPSQVQNYSDFPTREHISYSLRIRCGKPVSQDMLGQKILMSDLNPLFEKLPDFSNPLELRISKDLLTVNSVNHNRRGQNVLFCDGSVKFVKTRRIGIAEDDIFTLQDTNIYKGCEVPSCEADAFLAP
jgi:prepilin-type processing-associated H-X9-DG protein